ncbi:hypothetical protein AAC387_Pa03g3867 [Persea americana]
MPLSFCSVSAPPEPSKLFPMFFVAPTSASETFEMPTTIFFFIYVSKTPSNAFNPPCAILPGESELFPLGDSCFCPLGDCCRYLDGTIIAIFLNGRLLSSFVASILETSHFKGISDGGLEFDFLAGEFSLSTNGGAPLPLFPIDTDRSQPDKNCLFSILPPPELFVGMFSLVEITTRALQFHHQRWFGLQIRAWMGKFGRSMVWDSQKTSVSLGWGGGRMRRGEEGNQTGGGRRRQIG